MPGRKWAFVAATHRDHEIGLLGELAGQQPRRAVGEVNPELAHHLKHLRVNVGGGGGPSRERIVAAAGGAAEQRLAHLGAAGVLAADK